MVVVVVVAVVVGGGGGGGWSALRAVAEASFGSDMGSEARSLVTFDALSSPYTLRCLSELYTPL